MATYSFMTSKSWRIDVKGRTPQQAYIKAQKEYTRGKIQADFIERFGTLTKSYITYRNGLASLDSWKSL